jgi:hypothetical protein
MGYSRQAGPVPPVYADQHIGHDVKGTGKRLSGKASWESGAVDS